MLYYDDRDYFDYNNIDELYEDDDYVFSDESDEDESDASVWEYDYHNLTDELIDD